MKPLKLIFVGEGQVGKTAIINQYVNNTFLEEYITTMNSDKVQKIIKLENGNEINIDIWDTIGQIGYRAVNKIFMKNTQIALIVYDITNQQSFDVLNEFYEQINEVNGKENVLFVIIGNKSDLYEEQVVTKETGEDYAKKIGGIFFETTATDHECIENLFKDTVIEYLKKKKPELLSNNPKENNEPDKIEDKINNNIKNISNEDNQNNNFQLDSKQVMAKKKECKC